MKKDNKNSKHTPARPSRLRKSDITELVVGLFQRSQGEVFDVKTIFRELRLNTHPLKLLCMDVLDDLVLDDFIVEQGQLRYCLAQKTATMTGIFQRKANAANTVLPDDGGKPILVAERNAHHALHGDRVRIQMMARRRGHVREAQVTQILERNQRTFVGRISLHHDTAFLLTEDRTLAGDIFIPRTALHGAHHDDKAVVRITEWPDDAKNPVGTVVEVLGPRGDNETEMHAILAEFGLPYTYPEAVDEAARQLDAIITEADLLTREDLRDRLTFTIDPADAKDFDDALSFRTLTAPDDPAPRYEVGVHIADVSHYVTEGSLIDKEALHRATSIYLVDRTIPMLPERLCNDVCSLLPDVDRLTYSVVFTLDAEAQVQDWRLVHSVIHSRRRFAYEEVQAYLDGHNPLPTEGPALTLLDHLAQQLRQRRMAAGAVDFERPEVRFEVDEQGHPIRAYYKEATAANKLIEEFMLLANRTVAEAVGHLGFAETYRDGNITGWRKARRGGHRPGRLTLPYRIHDLPDQDKLVGLSQFVSRFGLKLTPAGSTAEVSRSLNRLLHDVRGTREQNLVEMVTLKAMMKAKYSVHNIGHYGLAFKYYTHFTSPIRRYPDLMVHRLLTRYAEGQKSASEEKYESQCEHSSAMEVTASLAERASIKYKQVEFMADHLQQVFDGVISGITDYGIYVELPQMGCEGMVSLGELDDDYYEFDERAYRLIGRRHHHTYTLGDPIRVRVLRANLDRKQLDFGLEE